MDRSTSSPTSAGEQNLTPGEQRILALLEQGQQRMQSLEQRMQSMEKKLDSQGRQLEDLTIKVDHEIGASKMRDRQLALDLQCVRKELQEREVLLIAELTRRIDQGVNTLRIEFSERFDQVDTRLGIVEQVVQLNSKQLAHHTQSIQELQQEVRKLSA